MSLESPTASTKKSVYRFSGHETFALRYAWLPKAYGALLEGERTLEDEDRAMVRLGVGKNMVKSLRFWVQAAGIANALPEGLSITEFGRALLDPEGGEDPFLEDIRTLWLIHWKLSTNIQEPLFAWEYLMNRWQHPDLVRSEVLHAFQSETDRMDRKLSRVTLAQHLDVFLHTYLPTRSPKGELREDNLDSPLIELDLLQAIGERRSSDSAKTEYVFSFNREPKHSVSPELFVFCVADYWKQRRASEQTLTFRDIAVNPGSVGQVFKLPEIDIRDRLSTLEEDSRGLLVYRESSAESQVTSRSGDTPEVPISSIFRVEVANA